MPRFPALVRRVAVVALCFASVSASRAQTYYWSAFAGLPPQLGSADGPAADARFNRPAGVVSDAAGNVYVADAFNHTIRHISAAGVVSTLAGSPGQPGGVVGIGPEARFANPTGLVLANGALFVTDRGNNAIRRVTSTGAATLFAGGTFAPGHADGVGAAARFNDPYALAADAAGDLYVTERGNHTVRKIARDGTVTTLAGSPGVPGSQDGPGAAARFRNPSGITLDLAGAIYIADSGNHTLRRIAADGAVTTFAGSPGVSGTANGTGAAARFSFPRGVIAFGDGTLAVVDNSNHAIRFVSPAAVVSLYAGRLGVEGSRDGSRTEARFFFPEGLGFARDGGMLIADNFNHSIRKISAGGDAVTTFAGPGGNFGRQDGAGAAARFNYPNGVAVHSSGDIYVADSRGNTIRRIARDGTVTQVAGGPADAYLDGPAGTASLNYPHGLAVAEDRTVYFCEQQRHTIRVLRPDGSVFTLAGAEGVPGSANATGTAARFAFPSGIALDRAGNLYVADTLNHTIRRIAAGTAAVTTLAGIPLAAGTAIARPTSRASTGRAGSASMRTATSTSPTPAATRSAASRPPAS